MEHDDAPMNFAKDWMKGHDRAGKSWSLERVFDSTATRLREEVARLVMAKLTLSDSWSQYEDVGVTRHRRGGLFRTRHRVVATLHLPTDAKATARIDQLVSLEEPSGLGFALAWIRHKAMGERAYVESLAKGMLARMARTEGQHCALHGIPPAPALLALQESIELDAISAKAPAAPLRRQGL